MSDNKRDFEDIEFVAEAKDNKPKKKRSKKGKDKKPKKDSKFKQKWMALKKWQDSRRKCRTCKEESVYSLFDPDGAVGP